MPPSIGVIDYGAGNIASVIKAVDYAGANPVLVSNAEDILECDKIILPGVGASGQAISKLREKNLDKALDEAVFTKGIPFMGICVGMHLLAEDMYEFGHHQGLGWLPAKVVSLQESGVVNERIPHMGWNDVRFDEMKDLSDQLRSHKAFYFAHSFTLVTDKKDCVAASVTYGQKELVAGIEFDNVCAFQFHPEKSQVSGDILIQWFIDWEP